MPSVRTRKIRQHLLPGPQLAVCLLDKLKALKPSNSSRKWKIAVNLPHGKRSSKSTDIVTAAVASAMCCRVFWGEFTGF